MNKLILAGMTLISAAFNAQADNCSLNVKVGDNMNFVPNALEISLSKCKTVTVNLTHDGKLPRNAMGHNWVLSTSADSQAVAQAGWAAGLDNQYLPPGDKRIIASTDIIGGGQSSSVTFDTSVLSAGGDYTFFCSFVGHYAVMKGKFTVSA